MEQYFQHASNVFPIVLSFLHDVHIHCCLPIRGSTATAQTADEQMIRDSGQQSVVAPGHSVASRHLLLSLQLILSSSFLASFISLPLVQLNKQMCKFTNGNIGGRERLT
jgi:hypothetical protein